MKLHNKPNLFFVGAAKAGTTSIYHFLDQHKNVYMCPIKEAHYFSKDIHINDFNKGYRKKVVFDLSEYLSKPVLEKKHIAFIDDESQYLQLYRDVKDEIIIGEVSNGYLYSKVAAEEIYKFNSNAKIIMVLRNPIDRAFSHWMMDLRGNDVCRKSFLDAIAKDREKEEKGWGKSHLYVELGLYYEQVKRFKSIFPKEHVLILLFDSLKDNPEKFFNELFLFLNIEFLSIDNSKKYNVSVIPKYPVINSIIKNLKLDQVFGSLLSKSSINKIKEELFNNNDLPVLTDSDKKEMERYFKDDIAKLEKLISQDLSMWLKN